MPLYLVIGYTSKKFNAADSKVLYIGADGAASKETLKTANKKFPVRERYVRPAPNGGRCVDASLSPLPAVASAKEGAPTPAPEPEVEADIAPEIEAPGE